MTTIVTDVHYRMSLALIRDLAQAGVTVVTCEREHCRNSAAAPALGALSRYTSRHVWLPEQGYLEALLALCGERKALDGCRPALLPVGAATLAAVAADRDRFDAAAGLCIPTAEQLDLFNSKPRVAALAERLGIPVPAHVVRAEGEPVREFIRRIPLPCVVKPACGEQLGLTAGARYVVAGTPEAAEAAWNRFRDLAGEDPVVQEYLPGGGLGCAVLAQNGQVLASICHRRVREYPVTGGPSSCCVSEDRPDLLAHAAAMVRAADYTGLAMFEFKEDGGGKPHLLEVNPRVWGSFPLTRVTGSGISLLWGTVSWNAGNPGREAPLPVLKRPRRKKMIFAASDLAAAAGYARRGQVGRAMGAVLDLVNPAVRDGLFEWKDMRPALAYFRAQLAKERL